MYVSINISVWVLYKVYFYCIYNIEHSCTKLSSSFTLKTDILYCIVLYLFGIVLWIFLFSIYITWLFLFFLLSCLLLCTKIPKHIPCMYLQYSVCHPLIILQIPAIWEWKTLEVWNLQNKSDIFRERLNLLMQRHISHYSVVALSHLA